MGWAQVFCPSALVAVLAKEATGKAVGNERLEAEGKADQAAGNVKQAGEKVKDAGKSLKP